MILYKLSMRSDCTIMKQPNVEVRAAPILAGITRTQGAGDQRFKPLILFTLGSFNNGSGDLSSASRVNDPSSASGASRTAEPIRVSSGVASMDPVIQG
jgi:hypothetical protein